MVWEFVLKGLLSGALVGVLVLAQYEFGLYLITPNIPRMMLYVHF